MAYLTFSTPARAGFSITSILSASGRAVAGFFENLMRAMVANSTAQARLEQVARLNALSDAQLAERGIKRADIAHHVFRDLFWN